jgi:hypothetical protein
MKVKTTNADDCQWIPELTKGLIEVSDELVREWEQTERKFVVYPEDFYFFYGKSKVSIDTNHPPINESNDLNSKV